MRLYIVPDSVMKEVHRTTLDSIARDIGIKDPHLSNKSDLIRRIAAAAEIRLSVVHVESIEALKQ